MAAEIALVVSLFCVLAGCVAVLVWDIQRRRIAREGDQQSVVDLQLRIAELEEENRRLHEEIGFLEKVGESQHKPGPGASTRHS